MKNFLLSCILLLMVYLVYSNGDAGKDVREPTASSQVDEHDDLRTNPLEVLVQQDQDAHRKRDLDIIQAFVEIQTSMKNLEQRIDGLTLENQRWKEQLQTLTASKMADEEETASFRLRMKDEIWNLKYQIQNITFSTSAETVAEVEPCPVNNTEDANQFQTSEEPETGAAGPDQEWLDGMLKNPHAKLYSGENFTGDSEWYRFENSNRGQCYKIGSLSGRVKSVETFGNCIRLFKLHLCEGWSLAVYPGSDSVHDVLNSKLTEVNSVGPCLGDEFQGSTFRDSRKENVEKNPGQRNYVPDLMEFYNNNEKSRTRISNSSNPITEYSLGPKNRVESLYAYVYARHLTSSRPTNSMETSLFFTFLDKEDGDVVGYGIPPTVGGPWDENYNVFSQTLAGSKEWTRITSGAHQCLITHPGSHFEIGMSFMYANDDTTRPLAFYYFVYCRAALNVSYGRVEN